LDSATLHWQAIWLTLKLATITTLVLMALVTPLGWWLAQTRSRWKQPLAALFALPLVLPPTVLGFYLLVLMGPNGPVGQFTQWLGIGLLPFTFAGLVVASTLYSLPFALQPVQTAFESIGPRPLEVAATLRASPWDCARHVVLPLARNGLLSAAVLAFAHTIGEFGVVLMIGGNIPGATQVLSVAIFNHVEALEYTEAHWLAGGMVVFSFVVLFGLYSVNRRTRLSLVN
jgi:molybdate transport system permease protein